MAAGNNPLRKIRLVYRRSSTFLKCMVLVTLILCSGALLVLRHHLLETKKQTEDLRQQAIALEQEKQYLENSISQLGTVQSVTELAGKLLGLVDPNTVIIEPVQ